MYTQKIELAIIFGHIRLGVENKCLENRSGRIFAFDKFTLQNLANKSGCVQTIQISDNWQSVSQLFKTNCIHSTFRTIEARVACSETVQKNFQNHLYGQPVLISLQAPNLQRNFKRVTLQHKKRIYFVYFLLIVL